MSSVSTLSEYFTLNSVSTPPPSKGDVGTAVSVEVEGDGRSGISDTVFLMVVASVGVTLNALVAASLLTMPLADHRRPAASFIIHACLLDSVKCVYCVLFAVSSLEGGVDPSLCDTLSRFV